MKTNSEIRSETRAAVRGRWFWRIIFILFVLNGISQMAGGLLAKFNRTRGILSGMEFFQKKIAAIQAGLDYTLPTREAYNQMLVATGFEYFVALVLGAIALYGLTAVALRAMKNDSVGWISAGVDGFRRPLGVTALLFVQNLIVLFWSFFFLIPGIVAAYRYRFAWYLKCENPDWGTMKCLGESARLIKGCKRRAFVFDCHYYAQMFLLLLLASVGFACAHEESTLGNAFCCAVGFVVIALFFRIIVMFVAGRAAFYREVRRSVGAGGGAETPDSVTPSACQKNDLT